MRRGGDDDKEAGVEKETARPLRLVLLETGALVRLDIRIVEENLPILDPCKPCTEISLTRADRLYLGTLQFQAGLHPLEDVVVPQCLAVDRDVRHRGGNAKDSAAHAKIRGNLQDFRRARK